MPNQDIPKIWTPDNAERILAALREFGAPVTEVSEADLTTEGNFYQIGLPPNRIDIITQLEEMDFAACWERRKTVMLGDLAVEYISLEDLLENKERTGRARDIEDAEHLRTALHCGDKSKK
ncbi:MAG: hypothetical protein KF756_03560 [Acidobacteria bacterium]|nr:hypothetical protein [Acidobacteriota bacterium]